MYWPDLHKWIERLDAVLQWLAKALPYNTSVGLNWSDAFIGKFPRFGVGITVGTTLMPYSAFQGVAETLDVNLVDALPMIEKVATAMFGPIA